jgi:hypothetical protein
MATKKTTVKRHLATLSKERGSVLAAVRKVILEHLPREYEQGSCTHDLTASRSRATPTPTTGSRFFAALGSHKSTMSLYSTIERTGLESLIERHENSRKQQRTLTARKNSPPKKQRAKSS